MKNKELILEAINQSIEYTKTQKAILIYFLTIEIEGVATSSPKDLLEKFKVSSQTIWSSLNRLEADNLVKRITPKRAHLCKFQISQEGLSNLISTFLKRKNYSS
jgi:DNA-binding MarR family transcriptional regulator